MTGKIEKMRGYIQRTPLSKYDDRYTIRSMQILELANMADDGKPIDAVLLAFEYGRAMGLRMGRADASKREDIRP